MHVAVLVSPIKQQRNSTCGGFVGQKRLRKKKRWWEKKV
jgi:hypothetical protein